MSRRALVLVGLGVLFIGGLVGLACSDARPAGSDPVSATEAGIDAIASVEDASDKDQRTTQPTDGGREGGGCTAAKGPCDLVLQDCPDKGGQKQECVAASGGGGTVTTECIPTQAAQQLPVGRECCPSNSTNSCLPGLECIGAPCGPDAGVGQKTGRCSPHCCPGDNASCGVSSPEGIAGSCEVKVTISGKDAFTVCSYKERCKPFGIEPCKTPSTACSVEDKAGTSTCQPIFNGAPALEHQPCGNGCADGMMCFSKGMDGGNECLWLCHKPLTALPPSYDAGALGTAAGKGGCPAGETCSGNLDPTRFPVWLSICL